MNGKKRKKEVLNVEQNKDWQQDLTDYQKEVDDAYRTE
jgi:hypothetical protein